MLLLRNEGQFRTLRTHVSQPSFSGNVADISELQALNCMAPQQRTRLLRSVSVISENKTAIARIKSIKLLTSSFLEMFGSRPNFQVVANSHFVFPAETHEHRGMSNTDTAHQLCLLSLIIK